MAHDAVPAQDVLPANEREALLAARHRPNAALQVMSQLVAAASLRETQVRPLFVPVQLPVLRSLCESRRLDAGGLGAVLL